MTQPVTMWCDNEDMFREDSSQHPGTALAAHHLPGGGAMGQLTRNHDWSSTSLGPVETWPQSLRTSVGIVLESHFAMYVAWGDDYIQFYNDRFRPILGATKHPQALGISARETFPEIWEVIGPMFADVRRGVGTGFEDWMLSLDRNGYLEECYFTFSYSPIRDEDSKVGGVLVTVSETTPRVLGERRLELLRDLAALALQETRHEEIWPASLKVLATNPADLAFCLLYRTSGPDSFTLEGSCGLNAQNKEEVAIPFLDLSDGRWPLAAVLKNRQPLLMENLLQGFGEIVGAKWPEPVRSALLLPVSKPGVESPYGLLIVGISPRRALDDQYRSFLSLIADQLATGIANVRAYKQEQRRVESLAEIDRAKTQFFSNVSHEFRTPLTLMLSPIEDLLASREALPGHTEASLRLVHRNGLRLLRLVNSLLDFSRIEAGRIKGSYVATNLSSFTEELASGFTSVMERGGLSFRVNCMPLPEPVWVDQEMWEKVILNLLSNAFKFTLTGSVTVTLQADGDYAELIVSDTGTGIPEQELSHLFERFHRVEGARGRTFEGTGIGLALVQELVKLHGGSIQVESRMNHGSSFTVKVPFGNQHLPADRLNLSSAPVSTSIRADEFLEEALRWLPVDSEASQDIESVPSTSIAEFSQLRPDGGSGARILVVDDNEDMRRYIRRLLTGLGYEVKTAPNGEEAFQVALAYRPELVLSDVMMPGLDGFGLLKLLRLNPLTKSIPVVLLSARAGEEARTEGLDAGADDYLTKPFTARELLTRVSAHLRLARLRRQVEDQARVILESITDGFFALDREFRITYANTQGEQLIGFRRDQMLGKSLWDAYPEAVGTTFYDQYERAMQERVPVDFESYYPPLNSWFRVKAYPSESGGLSVFYENINARKRAEEELRRANEDLEQFAYSASHDLQEPLRNVTIFSQLLQKRFTGALDANGDEFLTHIVNSARRMSSLLADLLAYARIGSSAEEAVVPTGSEAILEQVISDLAQSINESAAEVTCDPLPVLFVRPSHLRQLFLNLIGNAIKYRKDAEPARVHVSASRQNSAWKFAIADNGIGIEPEYCERIFGLFKRLHGGSDKYSGTGIGLAICQKIVHQYNGRIWVESKLDSGSTFYLTLPGPE